MKKYILAVGVICTFMSFSVYSQDVVSLEEATIKVASDVGKSVVSISSVIKEKVAGGLRFGSPFEGPEGDHFQRFFKDFFGGLPERELERKGLGSGVIIDKEGYILTNEHVIAGATEIKVKLSDGREFDAEMKGKDKRSDLAIIKIDVKNLPVAKLGNSNDLKIGNWVVAIGNPFGFAIENPEPTITVGVVSALHRDLPAMERRQWGYGDLIQTDAAINPGNSGGPLVNLEGKIVGINTAIITTSGGYQGLGFAIPINSAKRILNRLLKGERILYGWLGVNIQDLNDDLRNYFRIKERKGIIVLKVYKDSPAEKANLKEGDLILTFADKPIKKTRDLVKMVSTSDVGKKIPLGILRSGKKMTVKVKIGKMPKDVEEIEELDKLDGEAKSSFRGVVVEDITEFHKRRFRIKADKGIVIVDIEEDSVADKSDLKVGDVIVKIERSTIGNKEDFDKVISKIKGDCLIKTNRGYFVLKDEN